MTGISASTAWRLERKGEFPRRLVLMRSAKGTPIRVGWKASELQQWISSRELLDLKPDTEVAGASQPH